MPRVRAMADAAVVSFGSRWAAVLAALLALATTAMIVLALAIGAPSDETATKQPKPSIEAGTRPATPTTQPAVRYDGGPEEGSAVSQPLPSGNR